MHCASNPSGSPQSGLREKSYLFQQRSYCRVTVGSPGVLRARGRAAGKTVPLSHSYILPGPQITLGWSAFPLINLKPRSPPDTEGCHAHPPAPARWACDAQKGPHLASSPAVTNLTFLRIFGQRSSHFYFALSPLPNIM